MKIVAPLSTAFTLLSAACSTAHHVGQEPKLASLSQPIAYEFASDRPHVGDSFLEAVADGPWAKQVTAHNIQLLRDVPALNVEIIGFTDDLEASRPGCMDLAQRRALAAKDLLTRQGIDPSRIVKVSWNCNEMPLDISGTSEGRQINRRAEVNWR